MSFAGNVVAFFRLELADALRSKWLAFTFALYGIVFGIFVWLGLRQSSVLGFSGLSRVVLNVSNAVIVAFPLVVLAATSQVIVRGRTSGLFELLLAQPCRRAEWFLGVVASRVVVLLGPLLLVFVATGLAGLSTQAEPGLAAIAMRCLLVSVALVWAFIGTGLWLSSLAKTGERAMVYALLAWVLSCAVHDFVLIGALLKADIPPRIVFALAALNPVEAARVGILSCVDPELSVLGPVGFWLANALGPGRALAIGVGWPLLVGSATASLAARNFETSDLVA